MAVAPLRFRHTTSPDSAERAAALVVASWPVAARAIAGVNAAVVSLVGAAFYDPVWTSTVRGPYDVAIAVVGFAQLVA